MEILDLLRRFHDKLLLLAERLVFEKRDPIHVHKVALYGTMLELTAGVVLLIDNGAKTGAPHG